MEQPIAKRAGLLILLMAAAITFFCASGRIWADEPKKEILIGTHLPLSGLLASIGAEQKWAYETAVQDINRAGGVYVREYGRKLPVRLLVEDDQSSPAEVVKAVDRMIEEDKVDLLLSGHSAVFGVIPGCIAAETHQKYYHATACFIPPWRAHNFQWSTVLFFDMAQAASAPYEIWDTLPPQKRPQRPALIMEDTYDALALGSMFQKKATEHGYRIVLDISMPIGADDYTAQIAQAKEKKVDAILLYGTVTDSITFIRQMKEQGLKVKYLHGWKGTWADEFGRAMGSDAQYIVSDGHWSHDYPYPGAKELGERYYAKFHSHSVSIGTFYALAQVLWQAIEKAGTLDSAAVRREVIRGNFLTVLGPVDYNQKGVAIYPSISFQWIDGKQVIIYPFELAQQKIQMPPD